MIAFLRGRPAGTGPDYVIIDVGGIGYKVHVPTPVIGALADNSGDATVHTYMHVREDAMQLYGFLQETDREIFELLIQVSGIGPKAALAILSSMPVQSFIQSVLHEQVHILVQVPGVGKKTAQRVIIELKDKLGKISVERGPETSGVPGGLSDETGDALQALVALGYNPVEARRALGKIAGSGNAPVKPEDLVRMALKELARF